MYHFKGLKDITFFSVVVGGLRWLNLEGPCVYVLCHFPHVAGHIDPSLVIVPTRLRCVLCG
jgi:hypothetical protein